jgi:hypothetical protein
VIAIRGFIIQEARGDAFNIYLPGDDQIVAHAKSLTSAVAWCHNPAFGQDRTDQFWFFTVCDGQRLLMREERARALARHILEQEKK